MKPETNPHPHELLSAFSDQVATPEEAARLQEHLRNCAECRQLLHDLTALATAIGEEAVPPPPPKLAERIRQRIEAGSPPRTTPVAASFWRSPYPPALAATLLMATTLFLIWRREHVVPTQTQAPSAPVSKNEADSGFAKPAGPPPSPPTAKSDITGNEVQEQELKGLGSIGATTQRSASEDDSAAAAGEAPAARGFAPAPRAARQDASLNGHERAEASPSPDKESKSRDYLDVITASGLTGEDYKKAMAKKAPEGMPKAKDNRPTASVLSDGVSAGALEESAPVVSAEEARSLAYEGPGFSATFSEDGLVTLVARGYACSVTVPPSQAAPDGARARSIDDLASLFRTASSREFLTTGSTRDDAPTAMAAPAAPATSSLALRNAEGDPIHSVPFNEPLSQESPQVLRTLNQGIRSLIQQRYRKELESRCGPLPATLLSTP